MMNIVRVEVTSDYQTAERAGASPLFQVADINGYSEKDEQINLLDFIDQGDFYKDQYQVLKDLKENCSEYSFINCEIEIL